jgi:hypothetical protein
LKPIQGCSPFFLPKEEESIKEVIATCKRKKRGELDDLVIDILLKR